MGTQVDIEQSNLWELATGMSLDEYAIPGAKGLSPEFFEMVGANGVTDFIKNKLPSLIENLPVEKQVVCQELLEKEINAREDQNRKHGRNARTVTESMRAHEAKVKTLKKTLLKVTETTDT